ncbi:MAG: septum site-determining protein MinC [Rhodospirillales bacterium]
MPKPDLLSETAAPQRDPATSAADVAAGAALPPPASGFQLRGGSFTVLVLRISDPKDAAMFQSIADKVAQAPNFFRNAPVVIDLQDMAASPPFNIAELGRRLRQHQLVPIGVQNATEDQIKAATNAGLSVFPEGRKAALATPTEAVPPVVRERSPQAPTDRHVDLPTTPVPAPSAAPTRSALVVTQPVRSGQQIYAHGTDLVVLTSISPGAELLADGHIHVYGTLRGRALAGVSGDIKARIFCHSLEAELVSVAGYWRVREDLPDGLIGKAVQIALEGERLTVEALP